MTKFLIRFFLFVFIIVVTLTIYLSYFGIETDKFNSIIKTKANELNENVKLEFQNTKIYLNPKELNLLVKLQNPKIFIRGSDIILSKLDLFLSLKSFFSSDFLLKRAKIAFVKNDIKDLTKITNIYLPNFLNKRLKKIFVKGSLEGEFVIPFEIDGSLGKNYGFSGKISNATINFTKKFSIKNLTSEIYHRKKLNDLGVTIVINKGSIYDLLLQGTTINLEREENKINIQTLLHTNGKLSFSQIKNLSSLLNFNTNIFKDINGTVDLKTNIDFYLDKKFKIKNLTISSDGIISSLNAYIVEKKVIKQFFPKYDSKIILKDTNIKYVQSKSVNIAELNGLIKKNEKFDKFDIKAKYNFNKKLFDISGELDLTNTEVNISNLNYKKDPNNESKLSLNINFILNKYYNISKLIFSQNENKILLNNLKLNKNLEVLDFQKIEVKTFLNNLKNNDFLINKSDKIIAKGNVFDAEPLLKSLYKKTDRKTFSKQFNSDIEINFEKTLTGTDDIVSNFAMIASINKGAYNKLSLKGNYSENEIIEMSIYQVDDDKKTLQVISDRAKPFIKNFDFIKGFEGGKLEYESIISSEGSNSNLLLTDFKVSKVPVLAKLLTLASLQGIADTLSGEGIRFDSFEMKSNSEGSILNIDDALAMGPAVSILLNGYVDKGKVVSLRGTLVPATKLNSIIASIPIVGDILVGKKTGEGVVGVSFKMKGPPKDIKTTVNPIKTLTPRFIVRAVEKMQGKKKQEAK